MEMGKKVAGSDELALWYSDFRHPGINYNVTGPGFKPKVGSVTIAIERPKGILRKIMKIAPYSLPDGGFAVMLPYHSADEGALLKIQSFDTLSRSLILPSPSIIETYSVSSKAKLSFHADGATQFSSMNGRIISGRDAQSGEFKGLGIMARPFTKPVWSGPILGIDAWGLDDFQECSPGKDIIIFNQQELQNPFLKSQFDAIRIEISMATRRKPLASYGYFPDYRSDMRVWNPNSRLFGIRKVRLVALHSPEIALIIFAANFIRSGRSASGFHISSQRDQRSFGLHASYPRERHVITEGTLDFTTSSQTLA